MQCVVSHFSRASDWFTDIDGVWRFYAFHEGIIYNTSVFSSCSWVNRESLIEVCIPKVEQEIGILQKFFHNA